MKTKYWSRGFCLGVLTMGFLLCAGDVLDLSEAQTARPPTGPVTPPPAAPTKPQAPLSSDHVIRIEVPVVTIDVIATDKKGKPVRGLTRDDFEISENGVRQEISHFQYYSEDEPVRQFASIASDQPAGLERMNYIMLLFDNTSMDVRSQGQASMAATGFINENLRPGDLVAVVNYRYSMEIIQNFTENKARMARALGVIVGPEGPGVSDAPADSAGNTSLGRAQQNLHWLGAQFGARNLLLGLRELFDSLRGVKGRKSIIIFSGGVQIPADNSIDLIAAIDAANKANVTVYTIDARGLSVDLPTPPVGPRRLGFNLPSAPPSIGSFVNSFQGTPRSGGQTGGRGAPTPGAGGTRTGTPGGGTVGGAPGSGRTGGGTTGGNPGGTRGESPRGNPGGNSADYRNQTYPNGSIDKRNLNEPLFDSLTLNQLKDVLFSMALETGGFYIRNTNGFNSGLQQIKSEMRNFYSIGYESRNKIHDGRFRTIKVDVRKKGVQVKYRKGYFDQKSRDALSGTPAERPLSQAISEKAPLTALPLRLVSDYFYESPGQARVPVAIQLPISKLKMKKVKGLWSDAIDVLGVAFREDGSTAARFSDTVQFKILEDRLKALSERTTLTLPNYFNMAPGAYRLKVAAHEEGDLIGTVEQTIVIPPYTGGQFTTSSLVLSSEVRPLSSLMNRLESELLDEKDPLVTNGMKVYQSPNKTFSAGGSMCMYFTLYNAAVDPVLKQPTVLMSYSFLLDGKIVHQQPLSRLAEPPPMEDGALPLGIWVPLQGLPSGHYIVHVTVRDGPTKLTRYLTDQFDVEALPVNPGKK